MKGNIQYSYKFRSSTPNKFMPQTEKLSALSRNRLPQSQIYNYPLQKNKKIQNKKIGQPFHNYGNPSITSNNEGKINIHNQFSKIRIDPVIHKAQIRQTKGLVLSQTQKYMHSLIQKNVQIKPLINKDIFENLQLGVMDQFLPLFYKLHNDSVQHKRLIEFFKKQENFYIQLKTIITDDLDSRILYQNQRYQFFRQIPSLLNRILVEISKNISLFSSFKQGSSPYYSCRTNDQIKSNFQNFFQNLKLIQSEFESKTKEIYELRSQKFKKQDIIKDLQQKITDMRLESSTLEHNTIRNTNEMQAFVFRQKKLQKRIQQFQTQFRANQTQAQHLKKQIKRLNEENKLIKLNNQNLIRKIQQNNISKQLNTKNELRIKQEARSKFEINSKVEDLKFKLQQKSTELHQQLGRNHRTQAKVQDLQKIIHQLQDKYRLSMKEKSDDASKYYLESSDILEYQDTHLKSNLLNMFYNFTGRHINQFKLIYKYNKYIPNNIHQHIDNIPNFLFLIKLINNVVIGGFCPTALRKGMNPTSGFLFSLTANKVYNLIKNKPCFTYDEYYFTFGNSQIRIRPNEDAIFSSFGITQQNFYSGNDNISQFFNGGVSNGNYDRQIKMKGYQFYEVKFQY